MNKIRDKYNKLNSDETIIYQCNSKKTFDEVINKIKKIVDRYEFNLIKDELDYKTTYFLLGMWRDGMFEIRTSKKWASDSVYILADYKEPYFEEKKHLEQIDNIIDILDSYDKYFTKKRLFVNYDLDLEEKR